MLILYRKKGTSIRIEGHIKITVVDVSGNQVKLGVDAPKAIPVHREEIYYRIIDERKEEND